MKCHWETKDVVPGRVVCSSRCTGADPSYAISTAHKIGWDVSACSKATKFTLTAMTDGMTTRGRSAEDLAIHLTNGDYMPMPIDWLIAGMEATRRVHEEGNR